MKRQRAKKEMSLSRKSMQFMLLLVLIQGALFIAVFAARGGFTDLREKSCSDFNSLVKERSTSMENLMANSWSNLSLYNTYIEDIVEKQLEAGGYTTEDIENNKELNNDILIECTSVLTSMLRNNSVTEVYMILNGYGDVNENSHRCGVLIRDLDLTVNAGYEDLLLEVGPNRLSKSMGIAMDRYWSATFDLSADNNGAAYYWNVYDAVAENHNVSANEMGYWSDRFRWRDSDIEVISYSIPLVSNGTFYGVLGITVSENQLQTLMNYAELFEGKGSYILATTDRDQKNYTVQAASGNLNLIDLRDRDFVVLDEPYAENIYKTKKSDNYVAVHPLSLYKNFSIYGSTKWVLLGVISERELFSMTHILYEALFFSLGISVLLGLLVAFWGSVKMTRPITEIGEVLQKKSSDAGLHFPPSNIREVKQLEHAIITMDERVREIASKLSDIVNLVDMPLGAIEYKPGEERVFCTQRVITLLGMDSSEYDDQSVAREYFEKIMESYGLTTVYLHDFDRRYRLQIEGKDIWLQFKSKVEDDKALIVVMDVSEEAREKQRIEYERDYDMLTRLLNRRAFKREVQNLLMDGSGETIGLGAMIMWDLDNLKYINDSYGHDYGDEYIQRAADVFRSDLGENAFVGRISGDEFMAFVKDCENREALLKQIFDIKEHLNKTKVLMPDGEKIALRASGGIAWYPQDGKTYEELKRYADYAMYDTKNSYKGTFKEFDKRAYEHDYLLLHGKEQLNKLIDQRAVAYVFQPIVGAKDGVVWGYEALMRPSIDELKSPADVIRLARNQSRLADIETMTFELILEYCEKHKEALDNKKIFINSIPDQPLAQRIVDKIDKIYGDEWAHLVVEILESEQADVQMVEYKKSVLEARGAKIALDDFGVGYSSEATLLFMKPHYVKIDIAFCRGISDDKNRRTLVGNLIRYAKPRGVFTIAEGIENREDMVTLIKLGVDFLQGYYLGYPDKEIKDISPKIRREILDA